MYRKPLSLLLLTVSALLSNCGGMTTDDLYQGKSDISAIIEGQAAMSEQGMELRSLLNEIHSNLSRMAGYTPAQIGAGGAGKAFHIMSNINSVLRILIGASATEDDVRQFINSQIGSTSNSAFPGQTSAAYFDNIFACHQRYYGRNLVTSGLGPSVMTKLLNIQAKYAAVSIQYMIQMIPSMGKNEIKTTLGMARSARDALNKEYVMPPRTEMQPTRRPGSGGLLGSLFG